MKAQLVTAAAVVALGCAGAAYAKDAKTRDFLKNAMQGDSSEVMLGWPTMISRVPADRSTLSFPHCSVKVTLSSMRCSAPVCVAWHGARWRSCNCAADAPP